MKQGDVLSAMTLAKDGLKRYPSSQSEWHWKFLGIKAHASMVQGNLNEALGLLAQPLPAQFKDSDFTIRLKLTRALALASPQHGAEAAALIDDAEKLASAKHPELLGEVALRRGTVCFIVDELVCAESAYRTALQSARGHHDPYFESAALSGLGIVFTRLERYDEAIEWLRTARRVAQDAGARYFLEQILGNTAWCYRKLGDYENALSLYKEAEDESGRAHLDSERIYWLAAISNAYYEDGNLTQANEYLQQGLQVAQKQDDKTILLQYLNALAAIALDTGQVEAAENYFDEASRFSGSGVDAAMAEDLAMVDARIKRKKKEFVEAEKAFLRIASDSRSDSSQKWGAEAELAALYVEEHADAKAEEQYRKLLTTVEQVRSSVEEEELRMSFISAVISVYDDYIDFLVAHHRALEALQVAELSRARTLAEGLGKAAPASINSTRLRPQEIARRLNSVLLFYWVGRDTSYLWVISQDKLTCSPMPKRSEIEPVLQNYRRAILDGRDALAGQDAGGRELYAKLVAPARPWVPQGSRVVVLPGESLYGLNFETLIVPDPEPHYWIEDVTLSEAGSLTLLSAGTGRSPAAKKSLLLVGNPEPAGADFPALLQAQVEMQKVSGHFLHNQCKVLNGKQATASAYLQSEPGQFSYVHFVTHGTASLTQPLDSAVILSRDGDSYKLYARDIVAHPLGARLVTISACNGAGTRAYAGEGLVGLSWAFLRAGAHNVIASLWEVSDASSTGQLMDKLYEGLDRGDDPAGALRNAKLFILKSNSAGVFRKPFYWAPFQLYAGS